jgi:acetyltransferase
VVLNLASPADVEAAACKMIECVSRMLPKARIEGFTIQEMVHRPGAYELIAGVATDVTFGPVILFGHGGTAVEIVGDKSLELPPLNTALARAQIGRTRVAALLKGYRGRPAVDIDSIVNVLMQLSLIVADHAEIAEIDINPLLCDPRVMAVDAHPRANHNSSAHRASPSAFIRSNWSASFARMKDNLVARPMPEEEPALRRFADEVDSRDLWHAAFAPLRDRTHETAARLSQIDYDREMTMVAGTVIAWQGLRVRLPTLTSSQPNVPSSFVATCARKVWRHGCCGAVAGDCNRGVRQAVMIFPMVGPAAHMSTELDFRRCLRRPMHRLSEPQGLCSRRVSWPRLSHDAQAADRAMFARCTRVNATGLVAILSRYRRAALWCSGRIEVGDLRKILAEMRATAVAAKSAAAAMARLTNVRFSS